ncbi:MAG: hypothetical protein ACXV9Q_02950 [Chthoniobacterales bacterium]
MKTKMFLTIFAAAAALQFAPPASAQSPDDQGGWRRGRRAHFLASLSVDERAKLQAARQKALTDPAVQAAKDRARQAVKEFRDLRRAAMLRADPSIQPILDKMPQRGQRNS